MNYLLLWAMIIFTLSLIMTGLLRRIALSRQLLDVPNHRSSHSVATPRGGGVAIVIAFLAALVLMHAFGFVGSDSFIGLAGSSLLVAIIGFMDDLGHVAVRWRLLGQVFASGWGLFWLGSPTLEFGGWEFNLGVAGYVIFTVYLVWMLNLYNFMDGIDGIASVQALCACVGAGILYRSLGLDDLSYPVFALAFATLGFLAWNFPPAKIFMGDAGSGFLGILLALLSLQAAQYDPRLLAVWLVLLGVFIVDATFTLLRRLLRGEKVYQAHRSHGYQNASRRYGGHLPVTMAVLIINIGWLFPIAWAIVTLRINTAFGVVLAYVPLVALAVRMGAGREDQ